MAEYGHTLFDHPITSYEKLWKTMKTSIKRANLQAEFEPVLYFQIKEPQVSTVTFLFHVRRVR
jgi:uncharacterized membrane protein